MPEITDPSIISQLELPQEKLNQASSTADPKLQEAERTASFLATRVAGALAQIQAAAKIDPSAVNPSLVREAVRGTVGQYVARKMTPAQRQIVEDSQMDALDAALTLGTGAAYNKEQLASYAQAYFPQIGDDAKAIEAKHARFRTLLEAAKIKAGNAAPSIDQALANAGILYPGAANAKPQDLAPDLAGLLPGEQKPLNVDVHGGPGEGTDEGPSEQIPGETNEEYQRRLAKEGVAMQAGRNLLNVGAGFAEGAVALPDYAAKSLGTVAAVPFDLAGADNVANQLRNPFQFGDVIKSAVPVPQDWNNWSARQVARLGGGAWGMPARATNALTEMIAGKVPTLPGGGGNALAPVSNGQLAADSAALKIEPTMAAAGGPVSRMATAATAQTIGGARPIVQGAQRMVTQGGNALARIAGREGDALTSEAMGETATRGALSARTSTRNAAAAVYDKAVQVAGDARVTPEKGLAELDRNIAELAEVPGGADGAAYIQSLRDELATKFPNGVTVAGVRGMRTQLRQKFFKEGLKGSDIERRVNGVVDQISDDLATSLEAQGKGEAANLFRQGDQMWAERADLLDNVIMPIIGKKGEKSGEQVAAALEAATRGNGQRFDKFVNALPKGDAGDVRATIINAVGRAKAGAQDAEGDLFSFNTFLTNWNRISPSARKALFSQGDAEAMNQLARVSSRVKDASRYANFSNTGSTLLTGATGAALFTNPVATMPFVAGSYALGRVLSSAGGARLLMRLSKATTPADTKAVIKEFSALAARNPAAANDILDLQNRLTQAFSQSPARVAVAGEGDEVGQEKPR
jgi:hypothetical protein